MKKHVDQQPDWCPDFNPKQAIFDDLRAFFTSGFGPDWPPIDKLNALLPGAAQNASGQAISLVEQAGKMTALEYEQQIWRNGQVPTRNHEWHDLFNALMWSLFPRSKAAINALHNSPGQANPRGQRSRLRDALTLIDECGILIASCDPDCRSANFEHDWQSLFVARRDQWFVNCRPLIIGHGLYQQCLRPYLGLTAKALHLEVEPGFFRLPLGEQYQQADRLLLDRLQQLGQALSPGDLQAFPILGVPGWHPDNRHQGFYRYKAYFRSRKR